MQGHLAGEILWQQFAAAFAFHRYFAMMKEPTWGVKAAYGRVTPHLGSFCLCEFLGSSLSLEHSTNLSDGVYRHRAPEYPDKSHLGPDWPLSGALRSLPRRLTWDCVSPITISTIGDKPPRS